MECGISGVGHSRYAAAAPHWVPFPPWFADTDADISDYQFAKFKKDHSVLTMFGMKFGGRHYDLSKMSKKELNAARLGGDSGTRWSSDDEE